MPPIRTSTGRASKACEGCRKGKTRCYPDASGACLRCSTLDLKCSLQSERTTLGGSKSASETKDNVPRHDCVAIESRLTKLESIVSRLQDVVGLDTSTDTQRHETPSSTFATLPRTLSGLEAPIVVIRHAVSEIGPEQGIDSVPETVVQKGLISVDEAQQLLALFRNQYSRWITLREGDQVSRNLDIWSSPLLLCACCLIAIRHWEGSKARHTADMLFTEAKGLLGQQLLLSPQSIPFFQGILVLSLWSTTIGQKPLSLDSWMITGFAIQHSMASSIFNGPQQQTSSGAIGTTLLWTRLCLSHLHACVSIRRMTILSKADIDRITEHLPIDELSNFETRMVAELNLYWTIYQAIVVTTINIAEAQASLNSWKQSWSFLFDQPRSQFLEMGFQFAQLLAFEQALNNKSAAVRESTVCEMTRLCSAILRLAMNTTDQRTKHLTDHIYHMITFAAVTLCRLLCKYETQLMTVRSVHELDTTVKDTARWLQSLGTETHIGFLMGKVVDGVHRKLRSSVGTSLPPDLHLEQEMLDTTLFPDLLGMGTNSLELDWESMVPDWQSLASDETIHTSITSP